MAEKTLEISATNIKPYTRPYKTGDDEADRLGKMLIVAVEGMEEAAKSTKDPETFKILLLSYEKLSKIGGIK